ncbi:MAG: PqqD family protein [Prevotella sp.]|jgi:hypothetical protein
MKAKKGFNLREICGQYMIIAEGLENIDFSNIISLNETGAFIWNLVTDKDLSDEQIAKALTEEFVADENTPLSYDTALKDVQALHKQLLEIGIVE